jgi:2-polyprenyl-6-methoxyphenol hydroxylase-like FAD-dependent oxidoreductase
MSTILVVGGGVVGLSTAILLARQGHSVTVFEHDSEPLPASPEEAWCKWERRGVAQFRLPHYLHPPVRQLLDSYLPDVKAALLGVDCATFDVLETMPPSITDRTPREGDERFMTITGRRPPIEYAFASVAERLVPVRRGTAVVGLLTGPPPDERNPTCHGSFYYGWRRDLCGPHRRRNGTRFKATELAGGGRRSPSNRGG